MLAVDIKSASLIPDVRKMNFDPVSEGERALSPISANSMSMNSKNTSKFERQFGSMLDISLSSQEKKLEKKQVQVPSEGAGP